eukprot:s1800_g6.t1
MVDHLSSSLRSGVSLTASPSQPAFSWSQGPAGIPILHAHGPYFLELFAGTAGLSEAVQLRGVPILPPVDIVRSPMVQEAVDVVDVLTWNTVLQVLTLGLVFFLHCGTPCNTFTAARKLDGGPPPLRSPAQPMGLDELSQDNQCLVLLGHRHVKLKGKVWDPKTGKWVFRTKGAQVYPWILCATMAEAVAALYEDALAHLAPSFALSTPAADRKRPLGSGKPWPGHRQEVSAAKAQWAGYQLKRGATKPLFEFEMEPGQAIEFALRALHPFTQEVPLDAAADQALSRLQRPASVVLQERADLLHFWEGRAHALLPRTVALIRRHPDPALRRLLLGAPEDQVPQLGRVCHIELYAEMLAAVQSVDQSLPQFLLRGFPIVGPIAPTGRWPPYDKPQKDIPVKDALHRAWDLRRKIINRVHAVPVTDNLAKIWEASLEDVSEGSCLGPFESENEVSKILECEDWIPTQRFEVVQKNKVRGCDSATTNMINQVTKISEKLQLPSTDSNVAALRRMRSMKPDEALFGWVLDERKAYRQIAVRPDHRKFSVICLKNPASRSPNFFIMVGHSFGLVSAVYNYNRRSAAINEILVALFGLVAFSFYDDKYGFEPASTVASAKRIAESVHFWLGAQFDQKKLQLSRTPTILGVTYNLDKMQLEIKSDRKVEIAGECYPRVWLA